jgi:Cu/Ag efflux protein CusF
MEMKKPNQAVSSNTVGTIKSLDAAAHTVTLDTGKVCQCGSAVDLGLFKSGDKVSMAFEDSNGKSECCEMKIAA